MAKVKKDSLGDRMKSFYETSSKTKLVRRMPVAIRIDGEHFHTFTRGFKKPFDEILMETMQETMKYLCENIQGCVFGYTQSDEITLILIDYQNLKSSAWFDYEVQKMCSIASSMATAKFNTVFAQKVVSFNLNQRHDITKECKYHDALVRATKEMAKFDARCFNIPKEEVCNLILWRQIDATRNSIQMVGHANFTQAQLHEKKCDEIQEMLFQEKGINWNDFPIACKRGTSCIKVEDTSRQKKRMKWTLDYEMPILKNDDRSYVDKWIFI